MARISVNACEHIRSIHGPNGYHIVGYSTTHGHGHTTTRNYENKYYVYYNKPLFGIPLFVVITWKCCDRIFQFNMRLSFGKRTATNEYEHWTHSHTMCISLSLPLSLLLVVMLANFGEHPRIQNMRCLFFCPPHTIPHTAYNEQKLCLRIHWYIFQHYLLFRFLRTFFYSYSFVFFFLVRSEHIEYIVTICAPHTRTYTSNFSLWKRIYVVIIVKNYSFSLTLILTHTLSLSPNSTNITEFYICTIFYDSHIFT